MKTFRVFSLSLVYIAFAVLFSCNNQSSRPEETKNSATGSDDNGGITLPEGFSASIYADNLGAGRHLTVNSNGYVYLALRELKNGTGIVALRDEDGDGKADDTEYFGKTFTTGIEIKDGYLYYSNFDEVLRVQLTENELVPKAGPEVIATGFLKQNQHQDKTFTLDNDGNLYVNVGAPSNACQEKDRTPGSERDRPMPSAREACRHLAF